MITPTAPIEVPAVQAKVADGLWISNLIVQAPSTTGKITLISTITPMISSTGELLKDKSKQLRIVDVAALAQTDSTVAAALAAIYTAVQSQVAAQNLF